MAKEVGVEVQLPSEIQTPEYQIQRNTGQHMCPVFKWLSHELADHLNIWTLISLFKIRFSEHHECMGMRLHIPSRQESAHL